jgi:hypothetical protein
MKPTLLLIMLLLLAECPAPAQDTAVQIRKNAIYFEATGWGHFGTLNYDRVLRQQGPHRWGLRTGLLFGRNLEATGSPFPSFRLFNLVAGVQGYYLRGAKNHHLELGLGYHYNYNEWLEGERMWETYPGPPAYQVPFFDNLTVNTFTYHWLSLRAGYRFQRPKRGLVVRVGVMPLNWFLPPTNGVATGVMTPLRYQYLRRREQAGQETLPRLVFFLMPDLSLGWSF